MHRRPIRGKNTYQMDIKEHYTDRMIKSIDFNIQISTTVNFLLTCFIFFAGSYNVTKNPMVVILYMLFSSMFIGIYISSILLKREIIKTNDTDLIFTSMTLFLTSALTIMLGVFLLVAGINLKINSKTHNFYLAIMAVISAIYLFTLIFYHAFKKIYNNHS